MAIDLLNTFLSLPLEREFEGWITERILEYFESVNLQAFVWAVSPNDEKTWPADDHVWMPGKVFGLQFKRPYLADPLANQIYPSYRRLYWPLEADPRQFSLIRSRPEIFYSACQPSPIVGGGNLRYITVFCGGRHRERSHHAYGTKMTMDRFGSGQAISSDIRIAIVGGTLSNEFSSATLDSLSPSFHPIRIWKRCARTCCSRCQRQTYRQRMTERGQSRCCS